MSPPLDQVKLKNAFRITLVTHNDTKIPALNMVLTTVLLLLDFTEANMRPSSVHALITFGCSWVILSKFKLSFVRSS